MANMKISGVSTTPFRRVEPIDTSEPGRSGRTEGTQPAGHSLPVVQSAALSVIGALASKRPGHNDLQHRGRPRRGMEIASALRQLQSKESKVVLEYPDNSALPRTLAMAFDLGEKLNALGVRKD